MIYRLSDERFRLGEMTTPLNPESMEHAPSGWYRDPEDPTLRQFWDGRKRRWLGRSKPDKPGDEERWQAEIAMHMSKPGQQQIVCPHCGVKGNVQTKRKSVKRGISGGKATGAVLTLGLSTLLTGLSGKVAVTEMRCGNCQMTWQV